jgi:hypothetical protein
MIQTLGCTDLCGSLLFALRSGIGLIFSAGRDDGFSPPEQGL